MKSNLSKLTAFYTVIGGLVGMGASLLALPKALQAGPSTQLLLGLVLTGYGILFLIGGILLLKGAAASKPWLLLMYAVQLPVLYLDGFYFNLFMPVSLSIGKGAGGDIFLKWFAGGGFHWMTGDQAQFQFAGINFAALLWMVFLIRTRQE